MISSVGVDVLTLGRSIVWSTVGAHIPKPLPSVRWPKLGTVSEKMEKTYFGSLLRFSHRYILNLVALERFLLI